MRERLKKVNLILEKMFVRKGVLFIAILVALVAYKINSIYVIEGFENPLRYKLGNLILTAIARIVKETI